MAACLPAMLFVLPSPRMAAVETAKQPDAPSMSAVTPATAGQSVADLAESEPVVATVPADRPTAGNLPPSPSVASAEVSIRQSAADRAASLLAWASPYASGLYLCGVVLMLLRVALGLWGGRRLRRAGTPLGDGPIFEMLRDHARRMGMRLIPAVAYCRRISVPVVVGVLRPMILLPASLASGLTPEQLEAVLLHELAHVRRYDLAVNILQRLVEALLFFHPAVWWLSRRINAERENACDDLVVRWNCDRARYADALLRVAELCAAVGDRSMIGKAALAASGGNASQFKRRVLRLLDPNDKPAMRLTTTGVVMSLLLIFSVLLAPIAWRSAARAEEEPKAANAAEPQSAPVAAKGVQTDQPVKPETPQPVSMSAEEFGRLSAADQRALLVRVFQRRLEHAKNLYYEIDLLVRSCENLDGQPGKPLARDSGTRVHYRHWRLGASFRMDDDWYENPNAAESATYQSCGVNSEEGVGRNTTTYKDGKRPSQGQVQYPFEPNASNPYVYWFDRKGPQPDHVMGEYLFPYLIHRQNEFEIKVPVAGDKVQLTVPWQPWWTDKPGGKRVYVLDPRKGFLPIRCDSRWDGDTPAQGKPHWRIERFAVEDSRLVGDVWMPIRLKEETAASTVPDSVAVYETKVSRIEFGTVKPGDLTVPFTEGMHVVDTIEGVSYTADAQGKPAGPVKLEPNWKHPPPETWPKRPDAAQSKPDQSGVQPGPSAVATHTGIPSMASRLSAADRAMLKAEREKNREYDNRIEALLKVLQSGPPVTQDDRIEAGLDVLRTYTLGRENDERQWATAVRELIQIGKPAVPKFTEELDRTERDATLRALGFVLRGIADPRTIPALIRAVPKILQSAGSDCGLPIENDPELAQFMQAHDHAHKPGSLADKSGYFSYGRPFYEIMPALERLTGQTLGYKEYRFVFLGGGLEQRNIQRRLVLRLAERWADWWTNNWQSFVNDEAEAQLDRIKQSLEQYARSIPSPTGKPPAEFPVGPNVTTGGGAINQSIKSFQESPSDGFLDLDTGRRPRPPDELVKTSTGPEPSPELLAWAEREGVDLINVKVTLPLGDISYYAFKPIGMKVWRIDNDRFENIEKELRQGKKLDLPEAWESPLTLGSFLFITKEGTCGAIQIRSPLGQGAYTNGGLHYEFIYEDDAKSTSPARRLSPPAMPASRAP